jgi:citrate synthase
MTERIHTRIWQEEPEPGNDFATRSARCHGYDVYGDMLGQARWVEMLYLLFRGERPDAERAALLDTLAVALANAGPRHPAVHAAMCAGAGGSTAAASLMAALAVGAGQSGGSREVYLAMQMWRECRDTPDAWCRRLSARPDAAATIWPELEHLPGFEPHALSTATIVRQSLDCMAMISPGPHLRWLQAERMRLEGDVGRPLAMTGVAAAALLDLELNPESGEMLHLVLQLPGAAAHALEQREAGHKQFPFFALDLQNDPLTEAT